MKPFSENVVFVDGEFSTLDPYKGEILSIGLVDLKGKELYLELDYQGEYSDWVKENILSALTGPKVERKEAVARIKDFIGESKPFMISYVNSFDVIYFYKLLTGTEDSPFFWIPIDFASIMFGSGVDPEAYLKDKMSFARGLGIDLAEYHQHNALEDARLLREVYLKFFESIK